MAAHHIAPDRTGLRATRQLRVPPASVEGRIHRDLNRLLWQLHGESEIVAGGVPHVLSAGRAMWIPAGVRHSVQLAANSVLFPLGFRAAAAREASQGVTVVAVSGLLRTLLLGHWQRSTTLLRNGDLSGQIVRLIGERSAAPARPQLPTTAAALRVAETLLTDPGDERSVGELAAAAHVSYSTVKRAFLAETGLSPHQWRIAHRMEFAAALLPGPASIPAVASRVGYRNSSAFGRAFREYFGVAPSEFLARRGPGVPSGRRAREKASGCVTARNYRYRLPQYRRGSNRHGTYCCGRHAAVAICGSMAGRQRCGWVRRRGSPRARCTRWRYARTRRCCQRCLTRRQHPRPRPRSPQRPR